MTRSAQDPNSTDLVAGYILDDLSPEEADRLNQALAETPALHREIAAFGEAFSLIPYDMPLLEPSANLKAKILSAASQSIPTRETPQSNVVTLPRRNWKRWIPAISTGIAAVAVAALGFNQIQLSQQSQRSIALNQKLNDMNTKLELLQRELKASQETLAIVSQPGTQTYALAGATSNANNNRSAAQIFAKPGDRTVTLVAQSLPKLPSNQIYRLWAVATPKAAPTYCGQFRQDDSGTAHWDAPNPACTNKPLQLMITLDGPSDPTTSAGPVVMQSLS
jgi:anti-sigma-K factor RskA